MRVRLRLTRWPDDQVGFEQPYGLHLLTDHGYHLIPARMDLPRIPGIGHFNTLNYRLNSWQWMEVAKDLKGEGDVILCWDERQGIPSVELGRKPVVSGAIWATEPNIKALESKIARHALPRLAAVWVLSKGQIPALRDYGVPSEKIYYVPFGIDLRPFGPIVDPTEPYLIASAGNDRHRDWTTLLKAVSDVQRSFPAARLILLTPHEIDVPPHIGYRLGPSDGVTAESLFRRARVVVVPTVPNLHCSGMTVVLEAMASGRPVVATDTKGMDDYVIDGETGLLTPPCDPFSLADSIVTLLSDEDRSRAMGQQAAARLVRQSYSWEGLASRLSQVLAVAAI